METMIYLRLHILHCACVLCTHWQDDACFCVICPLEQIGFNWLVVFTATCLSFCFTSTSINHTHTHTVLVKTQSSRLQSSIYVILHSMNYMKFCLSDSYQTVWGHLVHRQRHKLQFLPVLMNIHICSYLYWPSCSNIVYRCPYSMNPTVQR